LAQVQALFSHDCVTGLPSDPIFVSLPKCHASRKDMMLHAQGEEVCRNRMKIV
jgi:hypothetical protein